MIQIDDTLIHKLEQSTGLFYNASDNESNVCFANVNDNLRDEYKIVFNRSDVLFFLKAYPDTDSPTADEFWKWVNQGKSKKTDDYF